MGRILEKEKGWEHEKYGQLFEGRNVVEVGSGLGFDAYILAQKANSYTCVDINPIQIDFIKRIHSLYLNYENKSINDISYEVLKNPFKHKYHRKFDGFYSHGVLHHIPFKDAQKQFKNINKYLEKGSLCVFFDVSKRKDG